MEPETPTADKVECVFTGREIDDSICSILENEFLNFDGNNSNSITLIDGELSDVCMDAPSDIFQTTPPLARSETKLKCKFCKLLFDTDESLTTHVNDYCRKTDITKSPLVASNIQQDFDAVGSDVKAVTPVPTFDGDFTTCAKIESCDPVAASSPEPSDNNKITHILITEELLSDSLKQSGTDNHDDTIETVTSGKSEVESVSLGENTPDCGILNLAADSIDSVVLLPSVNSSLKCLNVNCPVSFNSSAELSLHHKICILASTSFDPIDYVVSDGARMVYHKELPTNSNGIKNPSANSVKATKQGKQIYNCSHCKFESIKEKMAQHLAVVHAKHKPFHCNECDAK